MELKALNDSFRQLAEVLTPSGTNPVAVSPYFDYIIELALKGITPEFINKSLVSQYPEEPVPTAELIQSYIVEHVPAELRLPFFQLSEFTNPRNPPNPLIIMMELISLQRFRVGEAIIRETGSNQSEHTRKEIELTYKLCQATIKTAQELGQLPWVSPVEDSNPAKLRKHLTIDAETEDTKISAHELLTDLTPEEAQNILDALGTILK